MANMIPVLVRVLVHAHQRRIAWSVELEKQVAFPVLPTVGSEIDIGDDCGCYKSVVNSVVWSCLDGSIQVHVVEDYEFDRDGVIAARDNMIKNGFTVTRSDL